MNRCLPSPIARLLSLLALALLGTALYTPSPVAAQSTLRHFPPAAKRGMLEVLTPPDVLINGTRERLSPGARIKGVTNTVVMSGSLVGSRVLVNYVRDPQGMIHDVWILGPDEARLERGGMETIRNFLFESDADKPKTDDGKTPFDQLPKFPKQ